LFLVLNIFFQKRARFELCLYELESMGFIKTPKQQRSDTVIRLTWDFGQMQ